MKNKQTAIEWIENNLIINGSGAKTTFHELFEQAKAMEKEQIQIAFSEGLVRQLHNLPILSEQYYKETYGK